MIQITHQNILYLTCVLSPATLRYR